MLKLLSHIDNGSYSEGLPAATEYVHLRYIAILVTEPIIVYWAKYDLRNKIIISTWQIT